MKIRLSSEVCYYPLRTFLRILGVSSFYYSEISLQLMKATLLGRQPMQRCRIFLRLFQFKRFFTTSSNRFAYSAIRQPLKAQQLDPSIISRSNAKDVMYLLRLTVCIAATLGTSLKEAARVPSPQDASGTPTSRQRIALPFTTSLDPFKKEKELGARYVPTAATSKLAISATPPTTTIHKWTSSSNASALYLDPRC